MKYNEELVAFIRWLHESGYTQKQIQIITNENQSKISRITSGKTYKDIKSSQYTFIPELNIRKYVLDTFLEAQEIAGSGELSDMDKSYIRILKYCGVPYGKVRLIYFDRTLWELRNTWDYINRGKLPMFDASLLDLPQNIVDEMFKHLFS